MNNLTNETLEFLWYSYFGMSVATAEKIFQDNPNRMIEKCAKRAYRDLNRTLRFTEEYKKTKDSDKTFCNEICNVITYNISEIFLSKDLDDCYERLCCRIKDSANNTGCLKESFTDGHAQKWLNMTIKYMRLMGFWKNEFEKIEPMLHVPVDRYIIKAFKNTDVTKEQKKKYSEEWSKWNYQLYIDFQKDLRNKLKNELPIEWEGSAWIAIAEKVNGI